MRQGDLFENEAPPVNRRWDPNRRPDPAKIRAEVCAVIDQARAADSMPWDVKELRFHQTVLPQMCNWLPNDEAERLRAEFAAEVARLVEVDAG